MKKQNHTPGPWMIAHGTRNDFHLSQAQRKDRCIAIVAESESGPLPIAQILLGQINANASLISAAPELLECVEILIKACYGALSDEEASLIRDKAHIAIAKARGVQ